MTFVSSEHTRIRLFFVYLWLRFKRSPVPEKKHMEDPSSVSSTLLDEGAEQVKWSG